MPCMLSAPALSHCMSGQAVASCRFTDARGHQSNEILSSFALTGFHPCADTLLVLIWHLHTPIDALRGLGSIRYDPGTSTGMATMLEAVSSPGTPWIYSCVGLALISCKRGLIAKASTWFWLQLQTNPGCFERTPAPSTVKNCSMLI